MPKIHLRKNKRGLTGIEMIIIMLILVVLALLIVTYAKGAHDLVKDNLITGINDKCSGWTKWLNMLGDCGTAGG